MKNTILVYLMWGIFILYFAQPSYALQCQPAYPQFGTIICQGSTPPSYEEVKQAFQVATNQQGQTYSSITFTCVSDCFLESFVDIRDPEGRGLGQQGENICSGLALYVDVYKGNDLVVTRRPGGKITGTFPVNFDRNNPLTVVASCTPLLGSIQPVRTASTVKIKQAQIWLYEGSPDQPVPRQVEGSIGCIPNKFVQTYSNRRVVSGNLPGTYYTSTETSASTPGNYKDINQLKLEFSPTNLKPGQTYSYLYGWRVVPDINVVYGKDGNPAGYCGGSVGNRKLFSYSQVTTASGSCYLIPSSVQKSVQCCYEDCRFLDPSGKLVCDPTTFTCSDRKPCNSDLECQIPGEEACVNKQETKWTCDLSQPWFPFKGTCNKVTRNVQCCSDTECSSNQYCDREVGCVARFTKLPCPTDSCCIEGGDYLPRACSGGLQCCIIGSSFVGECKPTCAEEKRIFEAPRCTSDNDCRADQKCNVELGLCVKRAFCENILSNGDSRTKLDLAFIAESNWEDNEFKNMVLQLVDYDGNNRFNGLFSTEPLKSNKEKFNIWAYNSKESFLDPDRVDFRKVQSVSNNCPHADSVAVISKKDFRSFAYSGWTAFVSKRDMDIPIVKGKVLVHEIGHSLFGLADEYVEDGLGDRPHKPNCAPDVETARSWWGDLIGVEQTGFYDGCSYTNDNVRPTKVSIMGGGMVLPNPTFGVVNTRHIINILSKYGG